MNRAPFKVLLVDDEEEYVSALSERLIHRGMEVITAAQGDEALSILEEEDIDVVVIDLVMPGMSGLEVLRQIKKSCPRIEVILLTGRGSTREGVEGMHLGAFDYLSKFVDIESLTASIKAAAEKSPSAGE